MGQEIKGQFKTIGVILLAAVGTVCVFSGVVSAFKKQARFSEAGLHSNVARAYKVYDTERIETVIIGSSITGRFLGEFFSEPFQPAANLGMDAGGTCTGLEVFLTGTATTGVAFVETNTLVKAPIEWGKATMRQIDTRGFRIKEKIPYIREEFRPSGVLYTTIKRMKDKRGGMPLKKVTYGDGSPFDQEYVEKVITALGKRSERVILVNYPSKVQTQPKAVEFFKKLAATDAQISYLDLHAEMENEELLYTDQIHLTLPSAARVVKALEQHAL